MLSIALPVHWGAPDALIVYEFLTEVLQTIEHQYGDKLNEALRIECGGDNKPSPKGDLSDGAGVVDF
jgi:hypothetical protein